MIPVDQRKSDDCYAACLASILEVPYEEVPDLSGYGVSHDPNGGWVKVIRDWLGGYGLAVIQFEHTTDTVLPGWQVMIGKSPHCGWNHAVVAYEGEMVHDPHKSRAGVLPLYENGNVAFEYFIVIDPAKYAAAMVPK